MCGIAAIFAYSPDAPSLDRVELLTIRDYMTSRGPDGAGLWISSNHRIGLAHRRLSIIDVSEAGAQPMFAGAGTHDEGASVLGRPNSSFSRCCEACGDGVNGVTFNGEVYNYKALRASLQARGHTFFSNCDTEVLLHLYAEHGELMVDHLRGMYAFALWDEKKNGLFLGRDPYGIKPLYYADNGRAIRVASQVKALLAGGQIDTALEPAGHVGFFLWGHVPEPHTLYRGIQALPAGHTMWIDAAGPSEARETCSIPGILRSAESDRRIFDSQPLRAALLDSVRHHFIGDVPVGVFLSSGLDSTTLAALGAEVGYNLRTVTLGFEELKGASSDETSLAEKVAAQYHALHQTVWIGKREFRDNFNLLVQAMDQPSCDGVNSFFISQAAAKAGLKVALSGLGGDELFGGYPSFREIPRLVRGLEIFPLPVSVGRRFRILSAPMLKRLTSPKYAGLLEYGPTYGGAYLLRRGMYMPWELPSLLDPDIVREGWNRLQTIARLEATTSGISSSRARVSSLELCWYMRNQLLRDTDWAGMSHSVEVRTPLVDVTLLRNLAPLLVGPNPPTKRQMASAPSSSLPASILDRKKTGFCVPVREWLAAESATFQAKRGLRGWADTIYANFVKMLGQSRAYPNPVHPGAVASR